MPDISKIKLPGDNNTYDISDLVARGLLLEISQADYNALVQAGTVDPNVYYYIYDAAGTELPIDTALDTTSSNAIANGPVASFAQSISQTVSNKLDKVNPEGTGTFAMNKASGSTLGINAVAVGENCTASGNRSFAEGYSTKATALTAHSEGYEAEANGRMSYAGGFGTKANRKSQHVFGEYNSYETLSENARGNYVEIVGNGQTENSRSNARTLDWNGNETLAGWLKINGTEDVMTGTRSGTAVGIAIWSNTTGSANIAITTNTGKQFVLTIKNDGTLVGSVVNPS